MAKSDLTVTIYPKSKTTRSLLPDMIDQLESMVRFLKSLSDDDTTFEVISLSKNSPLTAVFRPLHRKKLVHERGAPVTKRDYSYRAFSKPTDRAVKTVTALTSNRKLPSYADPFALVQLKDLADDLDRSDHYATFVTGEDTFTVDASLIRQIESSLGSKRISYTSFTGRLGRINTIGKRWSFTIEPIGGPSRLMCYFEKKDLDRIRGCLREIVTIRGVATYGSKSLWPITIKVDNIEPKYAALDGLWNNLPSIFEDHWLSSSDAERSLVDLGVELG